MSDNPYHTPGPDNAFSYQVPGRGNTMTMRRIGMLSAARILGVIYALLGLVVGACVFVFTLMGAAFGAGNQLLAGLVGSAVIIVLAPLFYGLIGFVGGIVLAATYNFVASFAGGIQIELQPAASNHAE